MCGGIFVTVPWRGVARSYRLAHRSRSGRSIDIDIDRSRVGSRPHRDRDRIDGSIAPIHPFSSIHRIASISRASSSSPSSYLHTAHFLENVCPPRVLLRLPRRRLQGDQDPSTYCRVSHVVATSRRRVVASRRRACAGRHRAHGWIVEIRARARMGVRRGERARTSMGAGESSVGKCF